MPPSDPVDEWFNFLHRYHDTGSFPPADYARWLELGNELIAGGLIDERYVRVIERLTRP